MRIEMDGNFLYHWQEAKDLADAFLEDKRVEANMSYDCYSDEQSDCYHQLMDHIQRIDYGINGFKPGTPQYSNALLQVATWHAEKNGIKQEQYKSGMLVKIVTGFAGYTMNEPWDSFEPKLIRFSERALSDELGTAEEVEPGAKGMIIGEKLAIGLPSSEVAAVSAIVRFQKLILVTMTYAGINGRNYVPKSKMYGTPIIRGRATRTKTLVLHYNPMRHQQQQGKWPFVEWKQ